MYFDRTWVLIFIGSMIHKFFFSLCLRSSYTMRYILTLYIYLYIEWWSTPTKKGTHAFDWKICGLMAESVYGGDIQSIDTDH